MEPGTRVRLKADPGRVGVATGRERERTGRTYLQVAFPEAHSYQLESQLEVLPEIEEDIIELLKSGKFGRARDLRGNLTHIRLTGRLANLIYSMETTHTDFYAYQFKPVLNLLDSPSKGLLIADEVGLGKTIEAGLIWTELRSRFDIRRVLVVCPAMLQPKWKMELKHKFGISAEILSAHEVMERLLDLRMGDQSEYAMISSMQGLRPRRKWDEDDPPQNISSKLARFLKDIEYDEPLLDLLIIDEAHYLRNPESMTAKSGRLFKNVADHVLLLSATPIHLRNQDLYQLLNLVDEDTFNQPYAFDEILEANEPLIRARELLLRGNLDGVDFLDILLAAQCHHLLKNNRQLQAIIADPPSDEDLRKADFRAIMANRLETINLLGRSVCRTRKRDVIEWRVKRNAIPEYVPMTEVEKNFYDRVTKTVREFAMRGESYEAFLLVMPQRQMASSMPAALEQWQKGRISFDARQAYEDSGAEIKKKDIGPLKKELLEKAFDLGDLKEITKNDSKYNRLKKILMGYFRENPNDKVVLFSYFRPTIKYLSKRLNADGIDTMMLMGGKGPDRFDVIEKFKDHSGACVLLSSEVASEGIDLQFSRVIINYDLPWNPMKVEQRIGRIDRLGQEAASIKIWNLFYKDTIDARIYDRLYDRLKIFERALGGLEAVLGESIQKLTVDLLSNDLSPQEEVERIKDTAQAVANLRAEEERLEEEAGNLLAHGDYILNQVKAARELQRWITGQDLWTYVRDFFIKNYTGCEFKQLHPDELVFDITLSQQAKLDLEGYARESNLQRETRVHCITPETSRCIFDNHVSAFQPGKHEVINQFHPLVRFVSKSIETSGQKYFPTVCVRLSSFEIADIQKGIYVFSVERWSLKGIRDTERLSFVVMATEPTGKFLQSDISEKLVKTAAFK
jgi:SNF2 family DNA or RNA helicase